MAEQGGKETPRLPVLVFRQEPYTTILTLSTLSGVFYDPSYRV